MSGMTSTNLSKSDQLSVCAATGVVMGIPAANLAFDGATQVTRRVLNAQSSTDYLVLFAEISHKRSLVDLIDISVSIKVQISMVAFPQFSSPEALFNILANSLTEAASSGLSTNLL